MFYFDAVQFEFMGRAVTFDAVTGYGLICAGVFLAGFIVATRNEKLNINSDTSSAAPDRAAKLPFQAR